MKKPALIWDLDGTLLDSYGIIVSCLKQALQDQNVYREEKAIFSYVIAHSVGSFIEKTASEARLSAEQIKKRYSELSHARNMEIQPMQHAQQILQRTLEMGCSHYVYTHKGSSTHAVLENTGLKSFFKEAVTSQNGFAPKPSPAALNYLIGKYQLDRGNCFYVGDRRIDVECAVNAQVKSILFLPAAGCGKATGKEDYIVRDLLEIEDILRQ